MGTDAFSTEANSNEAVPGKTGRLPPIILTYTTNPIQLQKELKIVVKENFEFRSTRNGTKVITRSMADFQSVKSHSDTHNLSYYTFYHKYEKPMKTVIRHLPHNTPAEDISDGLVSLWFDVISVKQMTTTRRTPSDVSSTINLPLFLITLPRTIKSQEIFRLQNLCHIAIRVEAYIVQNGLTQCHKCQQFGHVWANCKQPPRCLWYGGGHLQNECPEKGNTSSTPTCCNCRLAEGERLHPANYRGCIQMKDEMQKKSQRTPKTTTGRLISSKLTTPGMSFAAALRGKTEEQQQPQTHQVAGPATMEPRVYVALPQQEQQKAGQSVRAPHFNSLSLDKMLKVVVMVVQQIMTESNGAVAEEAKILAITNLS
jgi:hypothetical protein